MEREVLTYPLTPEQLRAELIFMVRYFSGKGVPSCEVLFGFAWGNEYYPGKEWWYENVAIGELERTVKNVEERGLGVLGRDDLFVKLAGIEFRFCNDCDVHIYFTSSNEDIEYFYDRWKWLGYQPAEWIKNQKDGPGERVRFN